MEFPDFRRLQSGVAPLIIWLRNSLHDARPICRISRVRRNVEFVAFLEIRGPHPKRRNASMRDGVRLATDLYCRADSGRPSPTRCAAKCCASLTASRNGRLRVSADVSVSSPSEKKITKSFLKSSWKPAPTAFGGPSANSQQKAVRAFGSTPLPSRGLPAVFSWSNSRSSVPSWR